MNGSDGAFEQALRVLRRRKWIVLAAVICVPLAAYLLSSSKEKEYEASATLLFEGAEEGSQETSREVLTDQILAGLPVVAEKTSKNLGGKVSTGEILESVEASSENENANLTTITATTNSPELSAEIANAYSKAYVQFKKEGAKSQLAPAIKIVEEQIEAMSPEEATSAKGISLNERLSQLELEEALRTGKTTLVQPAGVPSTASAPRVKRDVIIGLLLGVILGLGLAALVERFDRRLRTLDELEHQFGLPMIAKIPRSKAFRDASISTMLSAPEAESFRILRSNLRFFNPGQTERTIVVVSPEAQDGKSTVARGLAASMAEVGDNVLLLEADLRKPTSFRNAAGGRGGLSTVLAGASVDSVLVELPISNAANEDRVLWVLPSGPIPPNPSELLESDAMPRVMSELTRRFDVIVVDTPALGFVRDALSLTQLGNIVLAVGALGRTNRDSVKEFCKALELSGTKPVGLAATLTGFDRSQHSYYMRARAGSR
jgi:polysaccharide biosynthesis transport protein